MANEDRILKILLQLQSDVSGLNPAKSGISDIKKSLDDSAKSAFSLRDAFKFAGAEEGLRRVLDFIKEIPGQIEEGVKKGIEFQAQLQQIQTAIAGVLRQNAPDFFSDFSKASQVAGQTVDDLRAKANQLGISYEAMFEAYTHSVNAMFAGGVVNIQQQINLVSTLSRALTSLGIQSTTQQRDIADLLTGFASRTIAGRQLAAGMGIDVTEFDRQIQAANQSGQAWQFWTKALAGYQEAGAAAAQNFNAEVQRMKNALLDLEGEAAKPVMQPLQQAIEQLTDELRSGGALVAMQQLGGFIANLVSGFSALAQNISGASAQLSQFAGLASNPVFAFLVGGAAKSATSLATGNLIVDLTKQSQAAINLLQNARDTKDVVAAQIALEQTNLAIKQQIGRVDGIDKAQLEGQLKVNEDILRNLQGVVGTAAQITPRHIANQKALEAQKETQDEINLLLAQASGDKEAVAAERAALAYDKKLKSLIAAGVPEKAATEEAQKYADAVKQAALATDARKDSQRDLTALLREENLILAQIRGSQQLIQQNPFLSADAKQTLLFESYSRELVTLNDEILKQQQFVKNTALDPAQLEEARAKLQQLQLEMGLLAEKMPSLSFGGGIQSDLVSWANSFGTTSHQIAGTIEGTVNAALEGTNQLLLSAGDRSTTWQQKLVGVEKQIASVFLNMLEKMAIQQALQLAGISTTTTAQVASGAQIAAAHAPAAAATSISSYGVAALIGEAAAIAAIFAIMGALGGFRKGGYTGDGGESDIAGPVHKKEFVFTAAETSKLGVPFLSSLARASGGVARFQGGGEVPGYYDLGGRMLIGGRLYVSPSQGGQPRSISGIDLPLPGSGFYPLPPEYQTSIPGAGLPNRSDRGGAGFDPSTLGQLLSDIPGEPVVYAPGGGPAFNVPRPSSPGSPQWVVPPTSGYPSPSGPPSGDWAQNAASGTPEFGGTGFGTYAQAQNAFIAGLINWNGPGQANIQDTEGGFLGNARHPVGALAAKFGMTGKTGSGKWHGKFFEAGGAVDSVPAMLSPGEFVMRKAAVDAHGLGLMHALNSAQFVVPRYAGGGFIGGMGDSSRSGRQSSGAGDVSVHVWFDRDAMMRHALQSESGKRVLVNFLTGQKLKLG